MEGNTDHGRDSSCWLFHIMSNVHRKHKTLVLLKDGILMNTTSGGLMGRTDGTGPEKPLYSPLIDLSQKSSCWRIVHIY